MKKSIRATLSSLIAAGAIFGAANLALADSSQDLRYAVPTTDMFSTTAYQLTGDEVEKFSGFFSFFETVGIKLERKNPVNIPGDLASKTPGSIGLAGIEEFRSGVYNSADHSLDAKTGIFFAQAVINNDLKTADRVFQSIKKSPNYEQYCIAAMQKDKVSGGMNMYTAKPTKEFWELVQFVKSKGFNVETSSYCSK